MFAETLPARYVPEHHESRPEGEVYRALDRQTGLVVRVVVANAFPSASLQVRQAHLALMRLAHPRLAQVIEVAALSNDRWYGVSEWLHPVSDALAPETLAGYAEGWLEGLAHLHAAGLVHGAIGPATLGLDADGQPKLGSAGRRLHSGQTAGAEPGSDLTVLAPELLGEARIDGRTDLYMLGASCFYWLTGQPAAAADPEALAALGAPWDSWLEGLLAPSIAHRFASAREALAALRGEIAVPRPAPRLLVTPFVGRRAELDHLMQLADEVESDGVVRRVTVSGVAGTGKSRLMEELRARLCLRGYDVLALRAGERADGAAYSAWAPLVPVLLDRAAPAVRERLAPVLATLLPGLSETIAPALEPRAERLRLERALATLIEEACKAPGLALCLDDWQDADEASRSLLDYLQRALPEIPLMLVVASQSGPDEAPPADGELRLQPFGQPELGAIYRSVHGGREPDGGWLVELEEATCGNPALVEDAVLACVGGPASAKRVRATSGPQAARTLGALWGGRLAKAGGGTAALVRAAAIAGERAPLALLERIAGLESETFLQAFEEATAAGLLSADGARVSLAVPRAIAREIAPAADAPDAHARALGYWQLASQLGQPVPASLLAHHALGAEAAQAGAFYALAAAQDALRVFALADAEALLMRGTACLARLEDAPAAWVYGYQAARGDLARYSGRGEAALAAYAQAIAGAPGEAERAELEVSCGIALALLSRTDEAEAQYRRALARTEAPGAHARAGTALARLLVRLGRADEALRASREALARPDAPARYRGEALGLLGLVLTTMQPARPAEGLQHLAEAQSLAEDTGDRLALTNACMLAGNARMALGQLPEARTAFERYYLLCGELNLPDEALCATLNLAQVAFEEGKLPEAFQRAKLGAEAAIGLGNQIYACFGKTYVGLAGVQLGYLAEAEPALDEAQAIAEALKSDYLRLQVGLAKLEVAIFLGRLGQAEELALSFSRRQETAGMHEFAAQHALLSGRLYELSDETASALAHYQRARALAEGTDSATILAGVQLGMAGVALRAGQLALAQSRAEEALEQALSCGAWVSEIRARLMIARSAWLRGANEIWQGQLQIAEARAQEAGAPHWQALVWQAIGRMDEERASLRQKAGAFLHFYLRQLPPRARQEFLNWPERREVLVGRPTTPLSPADVAGGEVPWSAG